MLAPNYSFEDTLTDSLKVTWNVEDLIGGDKKLDFTKPFMPEALAGVRGISCLSNREKLLLNQIRGYTYLHLFLVCEEFILPFVLDETRAAVPGGDAAAVQALATFAEEEAKHMLLFTRFAQEFVANFGSPCGVIGPAVDIANAVLSHDRFGLAIAILHLEWETLAHYLESIRDDQDLDPQFKSLLRHHWMEESQHAKLDTLLVAKRAKEAGPEAVGKAFETFGALGNAIDGLLQQQVELDLGSLEAASGRKLSEEERKEIRAAQSVSYRYTFLGSGLLTKNFLTTVDQLVPGVSENMKAMAKALSVPA
jgi:hypothetical protein